MSGSISNAQEVRRSAGHWKRKLRIRNGAKAGWRDILLQAMTTRARQEGFAFGTFIPQSPARAQSSVSDRTVKLSQAGAETHGGRAQGLGHRRSAHAAP